MCPAQAAERAAEVLAAATKEWDDTLEMVKRSHEETLAEQQVSELQLHAVEEATWEAWPSHGLEGDAFRDTIQGHSRCIDFRVCGCLQLIVLENQQQELALIEAIEENDTALLQVVGLVQVAGLLFLRRCLIVLLVNAGE